MRRFDIDDLHRLVIVQDELDLPTGRVKVKVGGGLAGHNGLRSIQAHLHTDDFVRVRIGVGKPPSKEQGADHVLKRPAKATGSSSTLAVEEAADAVELILDDGAEVAMNRVNTAPPDASGQRGSALQQTSSSVPSMSRKNSDHSAPRRWISPMSAPAVTRRSLTGSRSRRRSTAIAEVVDRSRPPMRRRSPMIASAHLEDVQGAAPTQVDDEHAGGRPRPPS